jgi:hypothetical protein
MNYLPQEGYHQLRQEVKLGAGAGQILLERT